MKRYCKQRRKGCGRYMKDEDGGKTRETVLRANSEKGVRKSNMRRELERGMLNKNRSCKMKKEKK